VLFERKAEILPAARPLLEALPAPR
jgi:hypothetical protein